MSRKPSSKPFPSGLLPEKEYRLNIWISLADLDVGAAEDDIESAVALAASRHWLLVGCQPANSVTLTAEGWKVVTKS